MKLLRSFGFAFAGIGKAIKSELNLKIHVVAACSVITLGFVFNISKTEWLAVILCIGLVIAAELMNTAVEKLLNFIHPGQHPEVGTIKDICAGAVLITATCSLAVALIIFVPYFIKSLL